MNPVYTSKTLYCYQFSVDFTYFVSLARELFLQSRLTFRENGRIEVHHEINIYFQNIVLSSILC